MNGRNPDAKSVTEDRTDNEQSATDKRVLRSQWESYEFRVPAQGAVRVENTSYGEDSDDHVYVVTVENGHATECTCPSDKYHSGLCKHRHAVERQSAVMLAASANDSERGRVLADGGEVSR